MTDTMPEQSTDENEPGWGEDAAVTYPDYGRLPEARFSVNFTPGRAPQLTVRGWTAEQLVGAIQELEDANAFNAIGVAHASLGAQISIGAGLGPATPVPAGAPAAPQAPGAPTPPPFGANVSVPGAPGFQGNAGFPAPPAPPAGGGYGGQQGGGRAEPKPRPPWPKVYKISLARGDSSFKDYRSANQQYFKGKVQWAGGGDYWIHGDVAQAVAQWNPVPA